MEAWKRGRRLLGYLSCGDGWWVTLPVGSKPSVRERGKKPTWKIKRDTKAKKGPSQPSPRGARGSEYAGKRKGATDWQIGRGGGWTTQWSLRGENKESGKGRGEKEEKIGD